VRTVALGAFETSLSAMRTHQIDGMMTALESGYMLEDRKEARVITDMERYAPHFHTHVIFARKALVKDNPALVERFLKGFFATIAYMKANREKVIEATMPLLNQSREVMARTYDHEISMLLDDGRFDPQAVAVIKDSFVQMGILPDRPRDDQIFTTQFLPVKP
jgi:ABC-type nitrate/sulfonate/bicarbonate transport system substrate-binding protein